MDNLRTVQGIYEAFARGDVNAIVVTISDDCRWEHWHRNYLQESGLHYFQRREGKKGVADFFASLSALQIHDFKVFGFLQGGNDVCAKVQIKYTARATGKRTLDEELHLWTLDHKGEVCAFRHYVDTAKHIDANRLS